MWEPIAEALAREAHRHQVDKTGEPYITHPERVVSRCTGEHARTVAWLHDVVEDTAITSDDLAQTFPPEIVEAVVALTHLPGEPRDEYYARVRTIPLALEVKLADVADNSDPGRLALLDEPTRVRLTAKYVNALQQLTR